MENGLAGLAIASFAVGNLAALRQTNVKRMLAYSTVGHTGFLLTAVAAGSPKGAEALLFYLVVYAAMNVGAFAVVAVREREIGRPVEVRDFNGYAYRGRVLAIAMMVFMLSLAGIPADGGLHGKLTVFSAAVDSDLDLPRRVRRDRDHGGARLLPADPARRHRPRRAQAGRGAPPGVRCGLADSWGFRSGRIGVILRSRSDIRHGQDRKYVTVRRVG